jgi:type I restriction enzyme S subunit
MSEWKKSTLGEIFVIARGGSPRPIDDFITDDPDGVNWVMISDAKSKYITSTKKRIIKEGMKKSREVQPGDFLLTNSMSFGRPYIMQTSGCIHDGWLVLSPRGEASHPDYFYHLLGSDVLYSEFERRAAGATVKNLNIELVKGVEISLPPLAEQRRIAEVLDKAEALRAKRRAALAQLDSLTQSLFLDLFGDPKIPARTIGDMLKSGVLLLHKDGNHGSLYPRAEDFDEVGIPFISAKAISDNGLINNSLIEKLREEKAAKLRIGWILKGDVLLAHNASVGKVARYDGRFEKALIGTSLTAFRPNPEALDSLYLAAAFRSAKFQRELEKNMGQSTRNQVPITAQRELTINLPPLDLQREFARRVAAVEKLKTAQRAALAELDALFASLQHRAFRGEL